MTARFEWDLVKAEANRRKHGVSFETAIRAFADPFAISVQDRVEGHEPRWQTIGLVGGQLLVVVAHTVEDDTSGEEIEMIRIISARKAEPRERRRYEQESR